MSLLTAAGVLAYAACATGFDLRERRIPNWLSATGFLAALATAPMSGGVGVPAALLGAGLGLGALYIPFSLGAVGGGDVKFAAVAGAWLGPRVGLNALLLGSAAGLFVALGAAALTGRAGAALAAAGRMVWLFAANPSFGTLPPAPAADAQVAPIPYAVPLAAGVAGAVVLAGKGWLLV
jgi:Flp pilus assembly protein protease CpaA